MSDSSPTVESAATLKPARLYYVDWLRVIAMLSIFLYHSNRAFSFNDWHISNATRSLASTAFEEAFNLWMMPLFFVLSGAAVYYSLKSRGGGGFVKERVLRILVPWVGIGVFVLAPPQIYLERLTHGQFSGSFFQFFPHYFEGVYGFGGNFAIIPLHLWYLMDLFLFSLIALPLFLPRKGGESLLSRLAFHMDHAWVFAVLLLAMGVASLLTELAGMGFTTQMGSWDMFTYLVFFLSGYLLFACRNLHLTMARHAFVSLAVAVILSAAHLVLIFVPSLAAVYDPLPADLRGLCAWAWIAALLGLGYRYLNFSNRALSYANEAVLPFYILHQPIILAVGFFIVQWTLPIGLKYLVIVLSAFAAIMLIYEFIVRRVNVMRLLFGMKLKAKPKVALVPGMAGRV